MSRRRRKDEIQEPLWHMEIRTWLTDLRGRGVVLRVEDGKIVTDTPALLNDWDWKGFGTRYELFIRLIQVGPCPYCQTQLPIFGQCMSCRKQRCMVRDCNGIAPLNTRICEMCGYRKEAGEKLVMLFD
jgi:hypothetical protein